MIYKMTVDDKLRKIVEHAYEEIRKDTKKKSETIEAVKLMFIFSVMNIVTYIIICLIILFLIYLLSNI